MREFSLITVFLTSLLSVSLITSTYSVLAGSIGLPTQGTIDYYGNMGLTLKFATDFEGVTVTDTHHISVSQSHFFWYGNPTAPFWMEGYDQFSGVVPHSGTRSLGQSLIGQDRNEFDVYQPWTQNRFLIREWFYFPADFSIPAGGWYQMFQFDDSNRVWGPWVGVTLWDTGNPSIYKLVLHGNGFQFQELYYQVVSNFALPRGQWFKFEIYIDRGTTDTSDGSARVWFNDVLWLDKGGLSLKMGSNSADKIQIEIAKMYTGSSMNTKFWTDDLEIYG